MTHSKKIGLCLMACTSALISPALAGPQHDKILEFDTMSGVAAPYTGSGNPIRGVAGGGLPWALQSARGELRSNGKLEIRVSGLVFAAGPNTGVNTVPNFRAIVSCQSISDQGEATIVNRSTDNFPASSAGDAYIEAMIELPTPCIAPIIFVTSPGGAWFAATGM